MDTFHYEQPQVTHLNEMILVVYTNEETYYVGSTNELNKLLSDSRSIAGKIDIQTEDFNNDGKAEEITVNIDLTGVNPADVKSVVVLQSVSYGISVSKGADSASSQSLMTGLAWQHESLFTYSACLGATRGPDEAAILWDLPDTERLRKAGRLRYAHHATEVSLRTWRN